jgi:hypothetical protein
VDGSCAITCFPEGGERIMLLRWIALEDIVKYEMVPGLSEAWQGVAG